MTASGNRWTRQDPGAGSDQPQDLDFQHMARVLRQAALPLLLTAGAAAGLTFLYSRTRPPVYQATASVAALPGPSGNTLLSSTLVTAPPLPPTVVERALHSPDLTARVIQALQASPAFRNSPNLTRVVGDLRNEQRTGEYRVLTLKAEVNQDLIGVFEVSGRAGTPALARDLTNASVTALLDWDRRRAQEGILRAQRNLTAQRDELTRRLAAGGNDVETRTLITLRADVVRNLQQLDVLGQTVSGTLSPLSAAPEPADPVAPRPLRDAVLVFAAVLFFGTLGAFLRDHLRRTIRGVEDLQQLGAPVLGTLPPLSGSTRDPRRIVPQTAQGLFREQMEFVRVSAVTALAGLTDHPTIVVSSAQPGEGKSTVVAGLAVSLAAHGLRVLVVDADIYRGQQQRLWLDRQPDRAGVALEGGLTLWRGVGSGIDLAVPQVKGERLQGPELARLIRKQGMEYDLIVVDTPPLLKVADALTLAARLDGLVLVADTSTGRVQVERAVQQAERLGVNLLGFVLNRVRDVTGTGTYEYTRGTGRDLSRVS